MRDIYAWLPFRKSGAVESVCRRYAWTVPAVGLLGFVGSLLEGVGITLLIPLLSTLFADGPTALQPPLDWIANFGSDYLPTTRLALIAGAIFGLIFLKNAIQYVNGVFVATIDGRISHEIRKALAGQLLSVGYSFFLREEPARLVNVIATESWRASEAIRAVYSVAASLGSLFVIGLVLLVLDWGLLLAVLVGTVLIRAGSAQLMRTLRRLSVELSAANQGLADRMLTGVLAMRLIRIYGEEQNEQTRFDLSSGTVREKMLELDKRTVSIPLVHEVLHGLLLIAILLGAILWGIVSSAEVLIAFLVLLTRMQPHLRTLEGGRAALASAGGSVDEVEWLLDPDGKPPPPTGFRASPPLRHGIALQDVSFSYGGDVAREAALTEVSVQLRSGRSTAVIGPSGSGKSTLINLICRLHEPTSGQILVDGQTLHEIEPASWRRMIGLAGQDIELLESSISANIAYGAADVAQDEIECAARMADADGFIRSLPEGYGTLVGSRGLNLSGGQRQRIGIARALVRQPKLLIFDEATNAVDGRSEASIMRAVRERMPDVMMLVISHRVSTLAACDDGVVLDSGRVVESGSLSSLEHYRRMAAATD